MTPAPLTTKLLLRRSRPAAGTRIATPTSGHGEKRRGRPSPGAMARFLLQALFNMLVTHLPGHWLRQGWLRMLGAHIGSGTIIFRGATVLGAQELRLGERVHIGFRVVLDARGGITVANDVNISSDSQIITAKHEVHSPNFEREVAPVVIEHHVWAATRTMILAGVRVGAGAVIAAGGVVVRDVPPGTVVAGVPAKPIGRRRSDLTYRLEARRPPLY
jgi:putative colanic acid biosynthesis acetyltransferase WcaF